MNLAQLEILRDAIASYLRGLDAFEGVAIHTRKDGDIVNALHNQIAQTGVGVELFIKNARLAQGQTYTVLFDPVVMSLAVYENVLVNRDPQTGTGKGAFYLIESALVALKLWTPPGFSNVIMPDAAGPQYGESGKTPTLLILTQDFETTLQLDQRGD